MIALWMPIYVEECAAQNDYWKQDPDGQSNKVRESFSIQMLHFLILPLLMDEWRNHPSAHNYMRSYTLKSTIAFTDNMNHQTRYRRYKTESSENNRHCHDTLYSADHNT